MPPGCSGGSGNRADSLGIERRRPSPRARACRVTAYPRARRRSSPDALALEGRSPPASPRPPPRVARRRSIQNVDVAPPSRAKTHRVSSPPSHRCRPRRAARPRPRPRPPRARRPPRVRDVPRALRRPARDPASRPRRAARPTRRRRTAISSADAEIPEPEARDDAATDAAAAANPVNDLQAQLAALCPPTRRCSKDLEKRARPNPNPEPAASTSAPAVPSRRPRHRRAGDRAPRARAGELLNPATDATVRWPHPGENPPFWEREPYPAPLPSEDDESRRRVRKSASRRARHRGDGTHRQGGRPRRRRHRPRAREHVPGPRRGGDFAVLLAIEGAIDNFAHVMDFDVPKGSETEWDGLRRRASTWCPRPCSPVPSAGATSSC